MLLHKLTLFKKPANYEAHDEEHGIFKHLISTVGKYVLFHISEIDNPPPAITAHYAGDY